MTRTELEIIFRNVQTNKRTKHVFVSYTTYCEAWREAVNYAIYELQHNKDMDKYYIIESIKEWK